MATLQPIYPSPSEAYWEMVAMHPHQRFELILGEVVPMSSSSPINTVIGVQIARFLANFVDEHQLGYVSGADGGYQVNTDTILLPNVTFIRTTHAVVEGSVFAAAPDLAVGVISKSESRARITQKVGLYLEGGTQRVWLVYPDNEQVVIFEAAADNLIKTATLGIDDILEGGTVLPSFQLPIRRIFAQKPQ